MKKAWWILRALWCSINLWRQEILRCFYCLLSPKDFCFLWYPACHVTTVSLWVNSHMAWTPIWLKEDIFEVINPTDITILIVCVIKSDMISDFLKSFNHRNIVLKIFFPRILIFEYILLWYEIENTWIFIFYESRKL